MLEPLHEGTPPGASQAAGDPPAPRRRLLIALLAGLLGFAAVSQAIVRFYQEQRGDATIPVLSDKLEALAQNAEHYDILFVGSSHVYRGIDPLVFDEHMRAAGCESRAFNMGVAGLNIIELDDIVERLAREGEARLRWLLVEDMPPVRPTSFGSERSRRVFGRLSTLPLAVRDVLSAPASTGHRLSILTWVLLSYAHESTGVGTLSSLIAGEGDVDPRSAFWSFDVSLERAGYLALEDERAAQFARRHERVQRHMERFEASLARLRALEGTDGQIVPPARIAHWRSVLARGEAIAARTALISVPEPKRVGYARALESAVREAGSPFPVFNFNDPADDPGLYGAALWFDEGHLARAGAARLSARMAREICAHTRQR